MAKNAADHLFALCDGKVEMGWKVVEDFCMNKHCFSFDIKEVIKIWILELSTLLSISVLPLCGHIPQHDSQILLYFRMKLRVTLSRCNRMCVRNKIWTKNLDENLYFMPLISMSLKVKKNIVLTKICNKTACVTLRLVFHPTYLHFSVKLYSRWQYFHYLS